MIGQLHDFWVTVTYHVRQFKTFFSEAADKNRSALDMNASQGLIQAISDNFDAAIHSQMV